MAKKAQASKKAQAYSEDSIKVLEGLDTLYLP